MISAGELGDVAVLDPAGPRDVDRELGRDLAGAAGQQDDAIPEAHGLAHVVGHEQDRAAGGLPDPLELVVEDVAGHGVERPEGLVHQQDLGLLGERAGEGDALAHAARELVRLALGERAQLDELQQLLDPLLALRLGHLAQAERQLDVALHVQPREQRGLLEHERRVADALDGAGGGAVEAGDEVEQRGLAAARGPEEAHELAAAHGQRDVLEGRDRVTATREHLRHVVDPNGFPRAVADPRGGGVAVGCGGISAIAVDPIRAP